MCSYGFLPRPYDYCEGYWNEDFLDEVDIAPDGSFVDQVDAASGALEKLSGIGAGVEPRIRVV